MRASFIVISWNAVHHLRHCLASLTAGIPSDDCEIIVVDNASSDGSREMVTSEFPSARLIRLDDNYGFAKASNAGFRQSSGRYCFLVNSDTTVTSPSLKQMFDYMDEHPEIGLLGPAIIGPDGTKQRSCMEFPSLWNTFCRTFALDSLFPGSKIFGGHLMTYWPHDEIKCVQIINGCFWMLRREAIEQVGLLDETFFIYGEDMDWCKRFHQDGWKVVYFPSAEVVHYGGASSANAPVRFFIEKWKANIIYWNKYHGRFEQILFLLLTYSHHALRLFCYTAALITPRANKHDILFKIKRSAACISALSSPAR